MTQQGMEGKRKLTAKDAITAGALGAVCIAIRFIFMLVGEDPKERPLRHYQPRHGCCPGGCHLDVPHHRPCGRYPV